MEACLARLERFTDNPRTGSKGPPSQLVPRMGGGGPLGSPAATFPGALAGNWIGSEAARTQTAVLIKNEQQLNRLCVHVGPQKC